MYKMTKKHKKHLSMAHKGKHIGIKNNNWKNGRTIDANGYVRIYAPDHPFCNNKGRVYEHRLVMEKYLGRYLGRKEIIHHINGIHDDNRIENLMLFPNSKAHLGYHKEMRKKCRK